MTLTFTESGLLTPATGIETSLEVIEQQFVTAFPDSASRKRLFENFQNYLTGFQNEIFPWFEMWVDGSFVTMKENPKDIDVVTFLDWEVYERRERKLERFLGYYLEAEGIDAYIVKVFPESHPEFGDYQDDMAYWNHIFVNNRGSAQKGFLKLKFGRNVE